MASAIRRADTVLYSVISAPSNVMAVDTVALVIHKLKLYQHSTPLYHNLDDSLNKLINIKQHFYELSRMLERFVDFIKEDNFTTIKQSNFITAERMD